MLVPAAVLVLVLLGAIAVDFAGAFLAQRQLSDAVSAAANDAATAALSAPAFYIGGGSLLVDPGQAAPVVCAALAAQLDARLHVESVDVAIGTRWIHVRAVAVVHDVVSPAVPGAPRLRTVRAAAAAVAVRSAVETVPDPALVWQPVTC